MDDPRKQVDVTEDTHGEQWRAIPGWEGLYEVSDQGLVRSLDRLVVDRLGRNMPQRGQLITARANPKGYLRLALRSYGRIRNCFVHHLVLEAFVGPRPAGLETCHRNGVPHDNRLANLRWGTHSSNCLDKVAHGTQPEAKRTHCPRQHELVQPNLRPDQLAHGKRSCLACARARNAVSNAIRAGRTPPDFCDEADRRFRALMKQPA